MQYQPLAVVIPAACNPLAGACMECSDSSLCSSSLPSQIMTDVAKKHGEKTRVPPAQTLSKFGYLCVSTLYALRVRRMMATRKRSRLETPFGVASSTSTSAINNDITSQNLSELRSTGCTTLYLSDSHAVETLAHGLNTYQLELRQCDRRPLLARNKCASFSEVPGKHSVQLRYNTPVHKRFLEPLTRDVRHSQNTPSSTARTSLLFNLLVTCS